MRRLLPLLLTALAAACSPALPESASSKFSLAQLAARYPADLGPAEVDVSAYPQRIREGYGTFLKVCSQCHTAARALNASEATKEDWDRHVRRMHQKTLLYGWWTAFQKEDAKRVLDFLVYDSRIRKLDRKDEFAKQAAELEGLFVEVRREKERLRLSEDAKAARPSAPYVGAKP